jgi:coproporphyrinogen III oxidase-like Fe-S oxidoreductase
MFLRKKAHKCQNPDEVTRIDGRQEGRHGLTGRYEVSNLSRRGLECRHNLSYWSGDQYVGLGTIHSPPVLL